MDELKKAELQKTKTRVEILNLLHEEFPLSADQIFDKLKNDKIKISSIYRNLAIFTDANIVLKSIGQDGVAYYQLNNENHKHQIICTNCNNIMDLENCPVHEIEEKIENQTGFKITGHTFEFSGICPECQKRMNKNI